MLRKPPHPVLIAVLAFIALSLTAHQSPAAEIDQQVQDRMKLLKNVEIYDFEPRGNDINSRDRDHDNFPDLWRRLKGPRYPLYEKIGLIEDPWRLGSDPTRPGTVMFMTFSGSETAAETVYAKTVDPELAYEVTAFVKTGNLDNSIVSIDIYWLYIDENGKEEVLGEPDSLIVPPGQKDWPEGPFIRRINDLHPRTNGVKLICRISDNLNIPGADRHGTAWFDDIRIISRPKIGIESVFRDDNRLLNLSINYQGLIPNEEDPNSPGRMKAKKYSRKIEIVDMNGNNPDRRFTKNHKKLDPKNTTSVREEIIPEIRKKGVYYVFVTLYGANNQPQATVTQVIGRWLKPRMKPENRNNSNTADQFSVKFDAISSEGKVDQESLIESFSHLGVFRSRIELWPERAKAVESKNRLWMVPQILRKLKDINIRFTGTLGRMPRELIPEEGMLSAMRDRLPLIKRLAGKPINNFGGQIDEWQWGNDSDTSFGHGLRYEYVAEARKMLQDLTSAFSQSIPLVLGDAKIVPPSASTESVNIFVSSKMDEYTMMYQLAKLLPRKFTGLLKWERAIYPSEPIVKLANYANKKFITKGTSTAADRDILQQQQNWINLELLPVDQHIREIASERAQAIDLTRKIIIARALGFERITCGALVDPRRGLSSVTRKGKLIPRPGFLAVRTLAEKLTGSEYLGSFQLGADIENFVFRTPRKTAIIAIWYTGSKKSEKVDIGTGLGKLSKIDISGNETKNERVFTISQIPILIDGVSIPLARTRMSIRVMNDPPLRSTNETQRQRMQIRNFFNEPLISTFRLQYAAYIDDNNRIRLEPGWTNPQVIRINLPPGGEEQADRIEARRYFDIRPTMEAVMGRKYVKIETQLSAALETRFNLLRGTNLTSSIKVKVTPISSPNPSQIILRLSLIWHPDPSISNPQRLQMKPYYQITGDQHNYQGVITVYPGLESQGWKSASIRDLKLPAFYKGKKVWVGADEDGGSRFVRKEVTKVLINIDKIIK
ncbi:MAG: hypothetical protein ACYTFY_03215 [Planctomycetota bacterium]